MTVKSISCHYDKEQGCHVLTIVSDKDTHHYNLESAMIYDFGIIHAVHALINLIQGMSDIFCYGKALHAANQEIELLEEVIQHLIRKRDSKCV